MRKIHTMATQLKDGKMGLGKALFIRNLIAYCIVMGQYEMWHVKDPVQ